jgi:hypothetical protein
VPMGWEQRGGLPLPSVGRRLAAGVHLSSSRSRAAKRFAQLRRTVPLENHEISGWALTGVMVNPCAS